MYDPWGNGRMAEWRDRGTAEGWNDGTAEWRNGRMAERPATYNGGIVDWWLGYVLNLHDLFTVHTDTDNDTDTL